MSHIEPIRYSVLLQGAQPSRPLRATELQDAIESRAGKQQGPFRTDYGRGPDEARALSDAIRKVVHAARSAEVGERILLVPAAGQTTRVIKIHVRPATMKMRGTEAVLAFHAFVVKQFQGVQSWGIHSCRPIAGTSKWSQHAYDNAEDWHAREQTMLAIFKAAIRFQATFKVATIIHDEQIWRFDLEGGPGPHPYSGEDLHHDHVHIDFLPEQSGTPPCALNLKLPEVAGFERGT